MSNKISADVWKKVDELVLQINKCNYDLESKEKDDEKSATEIRKKKVMLIMELKKIVKNWAFLPRSITMAIYQ